MSMKIYKKPKYRRGHRKPLSPDEPTVRYTFRLTESLKQKCIKLGPEWVRKTLTDGVK